MIHPGRGGLRLVPLLTVSASLAVGAWAGGCGGGGGEEEPTGPATMTPSDAPIYLEAVVRPQDDQREAVDEALSKLLNTSDPGSFVTTRIDQALEQDQLSYGEDIAPWLGGRAGVFVENFKQVEPDAAVVVEATDTDAARTAIDKAAAADGTTERDASYKGVEYTVDTGSEADGIVGNFAVAGTEAAFRDVVDVSQGDASLADNQDFTSELDAASGDPVFTAFANVPQVLAGVQKAARITPEQRALLEGVLGGIADAPALTTLTAEPDRLTVDTSLGALNPATRLAGGESALIKSLPGDSWAALGFSNLGPTGKAIIERLGPTPEAALRAFEEGFRTRTGFGIETDFLSWAGDVALFASGTGIFDVTAGAVLETKDTTASLAAIDNVQQVLESNTDLRVGPLNVQGGGEGFTIQPIGLPATINVVQRGNRIVAAYGGDVGIAEAFSPTRSLGDSGQFSTAADALGGDYTAAGFLDFGPLRDVFEVGGGTANSAYARAKPYLDHLDYLALGSRQGDDTDLFRAVLGLK
jgi:hypothetical protein